MSGYTVRIRGVQQAEREYRCDAHGPFALVVDLATSRDPRPCPTCGTASERTVEVNLAVHIGVGVFRGKNDAPRSPLALDTRPLAEGKMTKAEWKAQRRKLHRARRHAEARARGAI